MDSITHTLTGAVIAKAVNDEKVGNWGTIAGLAAGIFPDSDFVLGLFNRQFYLQYHRDFTHSLILIPFYALFFSWVLVRLSKRPYFWSFYKISLLALVSHVFLDLLTSYGTMIFSPFVETRYTWDLVFIVDLIFSGIVLIPWLASLLWKKKAPLICRGSLVVLLLYVLFCGVQHHQAMELAQTFGRGLNERTVEVAALPQPLSPFRWTNYVETQDRVYQGFVDLRRKGPSSGHVGSIEPERQAVFFLGRWRVFRDLYQSPSEVEYSVWQKQDGSPWVEKALATEGAKFYYWFARFPIAKVVNSNNGVHRVEFTDIRFHVPRFPIPFVYYIEFDETGQVRSEGFVGGRKKRDG